ncbi:hypothetical protein F5Y09DRAFT_321765 [Xylaria sp. FL1042]|nr:hypothetical protein F5Y09DRAFT_321765 [Xylaria sp. FL1042]
MNTAEMAETSGPTKKRAVSSCLPCYSKKQKCNRHRPCNHCTRRRRPEQCTYQAYPVRNVSSEPMKAVEVSSITDARHRLQGRPRKLPLILKAPADRQDALSGVYGYVEHSDVNTLGLLRNVAGLRLDEHSHRGETAVPCDIAHLVYDELERMPPRPVLDFLTQFFLSDVNWMYQLICPPSFLLSYESWWTQKETYNSITTSLNVADIDFAALILYTSTVAAQHLPSPTHLIDEVRGMHLSEVREVCTTLAESLSVIAAAIDPRGSLFRVQHMCLAGVNSAYEGRMSDSWTMLNQATHLVHGLGYHRDPLTTGGKNFDELEREMRRRLFCNLYLWDGLLSRQLDRIPCFHGSIPDECFPKMRLVADTKSPLDGPDLFTERVLQARLVAFWKTSRMTDGVEKSGYDAIEAEETYKRLHREFIDTLPAIFSFHDPDCTSDQAIPYLPMQRHLLYITTFESICHHFRPLLLLSPTDIQNLPPYKRVLISSQSRTLAHAALSVLKAALKLHDLQGGSHTRSTNVIFPMFEASVLILCLCIHGDRLGMYEVQNHEPQTSLVDDSRLGLNVAVGRMHCIQTAQAALDRLQRMGEVSVMAEVSAKTLSQLIEQLDPATTNPPDHTRQEITTSLGLEPTWLDSFSSNSSSTAIASPEQTLGIGSVIVDQLNFFENPFTAREDQNQVFSRHSAQMEMDYSL